MEPEHKIDPGTVSAELDVDVLGQYYTIKPASNSATTVHSYGQA